MHWNLKFQVSTDKLFNRLFHIPIICLIECHSINTQLKTRAYLRIPVSQAFTAPSNLVATNKTLDLFQFVLGCRTGSNFENQVFSNHFINSCPSLLFRKTTQLSERRILDCAVDFKYSIFIVNIALSPYQIHPFSQNTNLLLYVLSPHTIYFL